MVGCRRAVGTQAATIGRKPIAPYAELGVVNPSMGIEWAKVVAAQSCAGEFLSCHHTATVLFDRAVELEALGYAEEAIPAYPGLIRPADPPESPPRKAPIRGCDSELTWPGSHCVVVSGSVSASERAPRVDAERVFIARSERLTGLRFQLRDRRSRPP